MKKEKFACDGSACTLCKLCLPEWLPAINAHKSVFSLKKGEVLFNEGDTVNGIYFVTKGKMKVHKQWGQEKELIVRFAKEGDIVGHRGVGGSELVFPVSATALEPVVVCFIPLDFFIATLKVNTAFLYDLMMFYARELQASERKMRNMAHMPVKGRLAEAFLSLQEKFGIDKNGFINLSLSKQDIAAYVGTTYETAFRMMNDFVAEEILLVEGKQYKILQEEPLKQLAYSTH
ncbi:CRP-like cAMP-binding protein [Chitinophaga skermanii]|uniref:CRP-like cAMP-binding protein n=1 Tax=Chitinophaga skermanii TaxID=331697 RepID=A0A327QI57_9BACT|nr:Crp/Fnr family transcriptional regulator [Chitinophaga skermanii]RAJ04296.1 CRP-like cAMP-binding protein [Chitinophaga skermanii]